MTDTMRELTIEELDGVGAGHGTTKPSPPPPTVKGDNPAPELPPLWLYGYE